MVEDKSSPVSARSNCRERYRNRCGIAERSGHTDGEKLANKGTFPGRRRIIRRWEDRTAHGRLARRPCPPTALHVRVPAGPGRGPAVDRHPAPPPAATPRRTAARPPAAPAPTASTATTAAAAGRSVVLGEPPQTQVDFLTVSLSFPLIPSFDS